MYRPRLAGSGYPTAIAYEYEREKKKDSNSYVSGNFLLSDLFRNSTPSVAQKSPAETPQATAPTRTNHSVPYLFKGGEKRYGGGNNNDIGLPIVRIQAG
jgi:hypothetical protein